MVGRILAQLRKRGVLVEPPRAVVAVRKPRPPRPYAVRKPKDYRARKPGDIVQVDTLGLRPLPGVILKHFTARDMVSRWDVLEVHTRATATAATTFLDAIEARTPFPVRAIQVDGGSEFQADFETECQRRGIRLFVLPPRSPKLNGHVERAQRTHTEEFYEVWDLDWTVTALNRKLRVWERIYNTVRPHQSVRLSSRRSPRLPHPAPVSARARPCREGLVECHQCTGRVHPTLQPSPHPIYYKSNSRVLWLRAHRSSVSLF